MAWELRQTIIACGLNLWQIISDPFEHTFFEIPYPENEMSESRAKIRDKENRSNSIAKRPILATFNYVGHGQAQLERADKKDYEILKAIGQSSKIKYVI